MWKILKLSNLHSLFMVKYSIIHKLIQICTWIKLFKSIIGKCMRWWNKLSGFKKDYKIISQRYSKHSNWWVIIWLKLEIYSSGKIFCTLYQSDRKEKQSLWSYVSKAGLHYAHTGLHYFILKNKNEK